MRDCSRHDPQSPDQFQHATLRKHLGRLLISAMNAAQVELRAIPQFDCGRWKLRLERVPLSADEQSDNKHNSYEIETAIRKRILVCASHRFRSDAELQ